MNVTVDKLLKLVKKGPQSDFCEQCPREAVNLHAENGDTLLITALRKQRWDIVTYLLDSGADVTLQNLAGDTALHVAACVADVELCCRLVELGARMNARNAAGMTPLMRAAMLGLADVVECLLGQGAEVNIADIYGRNAALMALLRGHVQVVLLLEKHGASLPEEVKDKALRFMAEHNVPVRDFAHPFVQAVSEGNVALMEFYLELGMHFGEDEGARLVSMALEMDNPVTLDALLAKGCLLPDVEGAFRHALGTRDQKIAFYVVEKYPQKAPALLSAAIRHGSRELVERLCAGIASVASSAELSAALLDAIESGAEAKVRLVLNAGADFALCAELLPRMFKLVLEQDNLALFKLMLQHGCASGMPVLFAESLAAKHLRIARYMVEHGLVNTQTLRKSLEPALIDACFDGKIELVRLLLQMGVDVNATDAKERTPFNQALKRGLFYECINICCRGEWRRKVRDFRDILILLRNRGATLHAVEKHAELPSKFHQQMLQESLRRHGLQGYIQLITDQTLAKELLPRLPQTMTWI